MHRDLSWWTYHTLTDQVEWMLVDSPRIFWLGRVSLTMHRNVLYLYVTTYNFLVSFLLTYWFFTMFVIKLGIYLLKLPLKSLGRFFFICSITPARWSFVFEWILTEQQAELPKEGTLLVECSCLFLLHQSLLLFLIRSASANWPAPAAWPVLPSLFLWILDHIMHKEHCPFKFYISEFPAFPCLPAFEHQM